MKNTKKILSLLLAMLIFCQGAVLVSGVESSEGSAEAVEWTYDNSMLVKINTEESKIFTPEDFPDTNCIQVLTTEKIRFSNQLHVRTTVLLSIRRNGKNVRTRSVF